MDEVAALLREVIARPDDDGVRAVLADVLQAAGDPRGELISLQLLASRGNRDRDDRIRELLQAHGTSWLGSLRDAAFACRFDRGFPSRLALGSAWAADDPRWQAAVADPALATVEDLISGSARGEIYRKFLGANRLRRIEVFDRESLEGLAGTATAIEHVSCPGFVTDDEYLRRDYEDERQRRLARGEPDPGWPELTDDLSDTPAAYFARLWATIGQREAITSIGIGEGNLQELLGQRWYPRIRSLTIAGSKLRRWLSQWDDLGQRHLVLVPHAHLEPCERHFPWDFRVEVIPDGQGAIVRISGEWLIMPMTVLEALPPEVSRVEIEQSSPTITDRMRDHVARPGVEVVEVPLRADNFVWEIR